MATITTTSQADPLSPPSSAAIARDPVTGNQWAVVRTAASQIGVFKSSNNGTSWALTGSFTHATLQEFGGLFIDKNGYGHMMYRISTGSNADEIWYRRLNLTTGLWAAGVQASASDANSGTPGSRWQGLDCVAYRLSSGLTYVAWVGGYHDSPAGTYYGIYLATLTVKANGDTSISHNTLISGSRQWVNQSGGRHAPSIDLEHNGDGATAKTPNLWISFGRNRIYLLKYTWNGNGWTSPSSAVVAVSAVPTQDGTHATWDGARFLLVGNGNDNTSTVVIAQRNQANTATTLITTPVHPTGVIKYAAVSYDAVTKDVRVYAVGTSTAVLYSVDYTRATDTWGSWSSVLATAVLSSTEFGVRRGGNSGNGRFDVITSHSGSPNTVVNTQQTINTPPSIASFITSDKAYVNGGPADVGAALPLTWTFVDPDPAQTQGSYALSRQIGAGALAYWNAGTSSWGASEVQNSSATAGVTLASGWALDADAVYQYKVKVWDSAGTVAAGYSAALALNPSAKVNPALAAISTVTTSRVTLTWTAAQQTGIRVILSQTSPGAFVAYDSGPLMGYTDLTYEIPFDMATGTSWSVSLITYNNEGLASTAQVRTFSVAYASPPLPVDSFVASTALGTITVTPDGVTPTGSQPNITKADLYRREQAYANQLVNYDIPGGVFAGNWAAQDSPTVTASTTQKRTGTHALRAVPNGSGAVPRVQTVGPANTPLTGSLSGSAWTVSGWIRPDTANKPIVIRLVSYDVAGTETGQQTFTYPSVVAGAWHYVEFTAVPGSARVGMALGLSGTPAAGDAFYADNFSVRPADTGTGIRLYTGTVLAAVGDWGAASGVPYEYRWILAADNGTVTAGPWEG